MKRKIIVSLVLLLDIVFMFNPWFKGIQGVNDIEGTIMLNNPIAFCCLIFVFIGQWIEHEYGDMLVHFGWIGMIVMQIYEALTWHIRLLGGSFDLGLSLELCYPIFFVALMWLSFSFLVYKYIEKTSLKRL